MAQNRKHGVVAIASLNQKAIGVSESSLATLLKPHPRVRILNEGSPDSGGRVVLYWMQRSQRAAENPALNMAIALGNTLKLPVLVAFGLTADYPSANRRHYRFMLDGIPEIEKKLKERGVAFVLRIGSPDDVILKLAEEVNPAILISDENPLRIGQQWRNRVAEKTPIPFRCVDGDVVVPTSHFDKEEYAARTIRPKIHRVWEQYLVRFPDLKATTPWEKQSTPEGEVIDPDALLKKTKVGGVGEVRDYRGGTAEAMTRLQTFVRDRLPNYDQGRNEPVPYNTSELSAHLHFGQISPVTCALAALESNAGQANIDSFLEELIVRRELAINYVNHNPKYDRLDGCHEWALKTLADHVDDKRPYLYSNKELEAGESHDPLWNAAQKEMMMTGRMHNYLRMYWAKKILEWTPDAETAFNITLELNDRYEMDGRDPNGYTGVAWAIGGKHDRGWPERPIFGKIRFMSYESTRKKFNSKRYIQRIQALEDGQLFSPDPSPGIEG